MARSLPLLLIVGAVLVSHGVADGGPDEAGIATDVLVLSGALRAVEAERFTVPVTSGWQVTLKWLIPEGERVEVGDSIAILDPGGVEERLRQAKDELINKSYERSTEEATARLARMDLELALKRAEVEYRKAQLDADLPEDLLKGVDYRRRQLEMKRNQRTFEDAQLGLLNHDAATRSKRAEIDIEIAELEQDYKQFEKELLSLNLRATRAGLVVHEVHPWSGRKVVEGDRLRPTLPVARIPDLETLEVEAWAGESEIPRLVPGQPVALRLDAYPQHALTGRVTYVASAGERRQTWGRASYFKVRIALDRTDVSYMRPGMSVRCEISTALTLTEARP